MLSTRSANLEKLCKLLAPVRDDTYPNNVTRMSFIGTKYYEGI